jgi:hypothetical protein
MFLNEAEKAAAETTPADGTPAALQTEGARHAPAMGNL